jgi:hypothetical protein
MGDFNQWRANPTVNHETKQGGVGWGDTLRS